MKKIILFILIAFIMSSTLYAEELPDNLYGTWVHLEEPKNNEQCVNIKINDKTSKCFVLNAYFTTEFLPFGVGTFDSFILEKESNKFIIQDHWADYLVESKLNVNKENGIYVLSVSFEDFENGGEYNEYRYLKPISGTNLIYIRKHSPDFDDKDYYIEFNKALELGIPMYIKDLPIIF